MKKGMIFFQQSWNLISNFFIKAESTAAYFSLFTGLHLVIVSKCIKLFTIPWVCHNLSPVSNADMIWNIVERSWFPPWRSMFYSYKWAIKSSKNAKSVSHFSSSSSGNNFPFYSINDLISFWKSQNLFCFSVNRERPVLVLTTLPTCLCNCERGKIFTFIFLKLAHNQLQCFLNLIWFY